MNNENVPEIDFRNIRTHSGSQDEGFEEFCCQIAQHAVKVPEGSKHVRFRGAGGDGGVEFVWQLPSGEEWGWQAKYFFELDKQQLDKSVSTALTIHPSLSQYFICVPFNLTGPTGRPGKSQCEKYEEYKAQWEKLAEDKGMSIKFILWNKSYLIDQLLSIDPDFSRTRYWFDLQFLSNRWFNNHLTEVVKAAEPRYTPELTVDVPIYQAFEAFGRTPVWERSIRELITEARKTKEHWSHRLGNSPDPSVPELPTLAREPVESLVPLLQEAIQLLEALVISNDEAKLHRLRETIQAAKERTSRCLTITTEALETEHGEGLADSESFRQFMAEYQVSFPAAHVDLSRETIDLLSNLEIWLDKFGQISNVSAALVVGPAGIGKTHSICDIALDRLRRGLKSIVLLGEQFSEGEPWEQIRQSLGLSGVLTRDKILGTLNVAGEVTGYPCIVFIDALNETQPRDLWRRHLSRFVEQVSRYEWLKVCFSCRSSYLDDVIPDNFSIPHIEHRGFEGVEFEACFAFFEHYNLESPSMPLMQPEFSNPLFLRLVCESLRDGGVSRFPDRMLGFSEVVSYLLESKETKIAHLLDYNPREHIVKDALDLLTSQMQKKQSRWLKWKEAKATCDSLWPSQQRSTSLFHQLIREGIIKEDRLIDSSSDSPIDVIRYSFERLGDYLLTQKYLAQLSREDVPDAFEETGILHFTVKDRESVRSNLGLLEALALLVPERYGIELTEAIPPDYLPEVLPTVIESIRWRDTSSISSATEEVVLDALRGGETFEQAMEVMLSVSTRSNHRLNSLWFHNLVQSQTMSQRDAWLCPYLHSKYDGQTSVNRLIHWGLRIKANSVPEEIAALWVTQLGWFFAASDRRVRDNATKAVVKIMEGCGSRWPEIISRFSAVDDEYVVERILAAAYGSLVRTRNYSHLEQAANCVYRIFFAEGELPQNAMVRDYARLILELALHENVLSHDVNPDEFRPPYDSEWPLVFPDQDFVDKYRDSYQDLPKLYQSCFSDDFNRYTIDSAIRPYDDITLTEASRWIFKHVLYMGYSKYLHGGFDGYVVGKYGPGRGKPAWAERIGKKYQWIALYRLLARLGDHARLKEDHWDRPLHDLQARGEKNIDPTLLIRLTKTKKEKISWWTPCEYDFAAQKASSDDEWLDLFDFPDSAHMLAVTDPKDGGEYYVLLAYPGWSSRGEESEIDFDQHYRLISMQIRSYLVHRKDSKECWEWFKKQNFMGRPMPEGAENYQHFVGEYPWALPFCVYFEEYPEWTNMGESLNGLPFSILPTSNTLLVEQGYDASKDENFSIEVPAFEFFKKSELCWDGASSYLIETSKRALFFPAVYESGQYALLADREYLETFLRENDLLLIWMVLAEKQSIHGWSGSSVGYTKHSRAHLLKDATIINSEGITERVRNER